MDRPTGNLNPGGFLLPLRCNKGQLSVSHHITGPTSVLFSLMGPVIICRTVGKIHKKSIKYAIYQLTKEKVTCMICK